jgi:tryptophanyl-tRNA synthetase
MTIEEAKQRIKVLHEVADLIYEQAWQSAKLPENMRADLFDYLYNDYATPDMQKENYNTMKEKFDNGQITEQEWKAFCFEVLAEILDDCKDVMVRLKER